MCETIQATNYHYWVSIFSETGRQDQTDKWKLFKEIKPLKALKVDAYMVEQSLLVYECKQERLIELPDHSLLIGKVEIIHYKKGKLKPEKARYPLHMGKAYFSKNTRAKAYIL